MSTPHPVTIALERGLRSMKIELPDHTQLQLLRYLDEMARWNTAYNLTAIRTAGDMVIRHLLDSLALSRERSEQRRVGTEWVSKGRLRWSPYHAKKTTIIITPKK